MKQYPIAVRAVVSDRVVGLSPLEARLVHRLAESQGEVVEVPALVAFVWEGRQGLVSGYASLMVLINATRKKLPGLIVNRRGRGWLLRGRRELRLTRFVEGGEPGLRLTLIGERDNTLEVPSSMLPRPATAGQRARALGREPNAT